MRILLVSPVVGRTILVSSRAIVEKPAPLELGCVAKTGIDLVKVVITFTASKHRYPHSYNNSNITDVCLDSTLRNKELVGFDICIYGQNLKAIHFHA